jgi:hypothetical protein
MILYEVSGSQWSSSFYRTLREARATFDRLKEQGQDADLMKVLVEISAERQIELLNGYWANARRIIEEIDSFDPQGE